MLFDLGYPAHQARFARPGARGTSLQDFFARFPDETACLRYVFGRRYTDDATCPKCAVPCRWGVSKGRRMLVHRTCKTHISPYAGTAMAHSRIPTQLWFYAMLHLANSPESANAYFFCRHLGLSLRASQRMLRRLRLHLAALDHRSLVAAPGREVHIRLERLRGVANPMSPKRNVATVLFIESDGWVDSIVIDQSRRTRLRKLLVERLPDDARVFTTCYRTSRVVSDYGRYKAPPIEFRPEHFSGEGDTTDLITSFLAYFRRGSRLQHQTIPVTYLWLFLREYQFRYNRRSRSQDTYWDMVRAFPVVDDHTEESLRRFYSDV